MVKPSDINTRVHFWDAFGHYETEVSANYIVRYCQENGNEWQRFTFQQIQDFYNRKRERKEVFLFNGLEQTYITLDLDGYYTIQPTFITRCLLSTQEHNE